MPDQSPQDYFSALGSVCDTWNIDFWPLQGNKGGTLDGSQFAASVKTSAMARSEMDNSSSSNVLDYYWLEHDIELTAPVKITNSKAGWLDQLGITRDVVPPAGNWSIRSLHIEVAQWDQSPSAPQMVNSQPAPNLPPPQVLQARATSRCGPTSPETQIMATTEGTSISTTIGASAGFFDEAVTGSISASITTSHSTSRTIPDVGFSNQQQHDKAIYTYSFADYNPEGQQSFQPTVQHIFSCDDDLQGLRSLKPEDVGSARAALFLMTMTLQVDVAWQESMGGLPIPTDWDSHDPESFTATVSRLFAVRLPPLPKSMTPTPPAA